MKFLVPNYSCLQNPLTKGLPPPDPRPLCPLSSTEFVEHPPEKSSWVRHCSGHPQLSQRFRLPGLLKAKLVCNCIEHCVLSQSDCTLKRKRENN